MSLAPPPEEAGAAGAAEGTPVTAVAAPDVVPRVSPGFRLQFEPAQDCHVLLYPEGMVKLNGSAGEIMKRCNGEKTVQAIVANLETAFGMKGLEGDVIAFIEMAAKQRWLTWA